MVAIPKFILNRLYVSGSLKALSTEEFEGIVFDIRNSLAPGWLVKVNQIRLNSVAFEAAQILIKVGDTLFEADQIDDENPAKVLLNDTVRCLLKGAKLEPGSYDITLDMVGKDIGPVVVSFKDQLKNA